MASENKPSFSADKVNRLFPSISAPPSQNSPTRALGISAWSSEALLKILRENHINYHCFFNDMGFHDHISHTTLALYALGAPGYLIQSSYERESERQRVPYNSPNTINENNFAEHLGNEDYYNAYLRFFSELLLDDGLEVSTVLEKFIFSEQYNFGSGTGEPPKMLNRFFGGLLHPLIHTSNGLEFGLKGLVAEGLAQAAVHRVEDILDRSFFDFSPSGGAATSIVSQLTNALPRLTLQQAPQSTADKANGEGHGSQHLFAVMARMLNDHRLDSSTLELDKKDNFMKYLFTVKTCSAIVREYVRQWDVSFSSDSDALDKKIAELYWANVLIYGVGGWKAQKEFKSNFFFMHLVTSSIFLHTVVASLSSPSSKVTFIRAYCAFALTWWVAWGRPGFSINRFYEATGGDDETAIARAIIPGPQPSPSKNALGSSSTQAFTPNPWFAILQSTLVHPNDHIAKLQRSLAHASSLYGTTPRGHFAHLRQSCESEVTGSGFDGLERLDGTLFVRAARLSIDYMGWVREGEEGRDWSFEL